MIWFHSGNRLNSQAVSNKLNVIPEKPIQEIQFLHLTDESNEKILRDY